MQRIFLFVFAVGLPLVSSYICDDYVYWNAANSWSFNNECSYACRSGDPIGPNCRYDSCSADVGVSQPITGSLIYQTEALCQYGCQIGNLGNNCIAYLYHPPTGKCGYVRPSYPNVDMTPGDIIYGPTYCVDPATTTTTTSTSTTTTTSTSTTTTTSTSTTTTTST
eukprot:Polyplicarium_translucidae@DN3245_c1_g1_i7.p2